MISVMMPARFTGMRQLLELDLRIAGHGRLAGEDGAPESRAVIVDRSGDDRHPAALALARTAILRDEQRTPERRIDEGLTDIGVDGLAVERNLTTHTHTRSNAPTHGAMAYSWVVTRTARECTV